MPDIAHPPHLLHCNNNEFTFRVGRSPRPFDTKSIINELNQILRLQLIKEQSISVIYQKSGARSGRFANRL